MNNSNEYTSCENIANSIPYYIPERKKYIYTRAHAFLALLTFVLGSLWYRWLFFYQENGIFRECRAAGITVFTAMFFVVTLCFFKVRNRIIGKDSVIIMCAAILFSTRFALYYNDTSSSPALLAFFLLHICALLFLYCIGTQKALDGIVKSVFMCVFVAPFASFHRIYVSLSAFFKFRKSTDEEKRKSVKLISNIGLVLLTLFCLIPVFTVITALLFSDGFFSDFLGGISEFLSGIDINFRLGNYFNPITLLVSMYIFSAIFEADKNADKQTVYVPKANCGIMPPVIARTALVSLIVIYGIFIVAQIDGFAHMFMGVLPDGITYAEFARSGFFELCIVACINGMVLYILEILTDKATGKSPTVTKVMLIVFTVLLIFTAATKMLMYITAYGFTPKRFYTLWFMLLLTILFGMALVKLRKADFRLSRYSVYITLTLLAVLFLTDFEGISHMLNNKYF